MKRTRFYLVVGIVALLGLGAGSTVAKFHSRNAATEAGSTASEIPAPASLEQLVKSSDVIVIGTFRTVTNEGRFYGYDEGAEKRADLDRESPTPLSVPITDFEFDVEKVLRDDGRRPNGEPLIVRFVAERSESGMPQLGDRRLLFLKVTPDQRTYGIESFVGQLDITGGTVVFHKGHQAMLPFGKKYRPYELIEGIERALANLSSPRESYQQ